MVDNTGEKPQLIVDLWSETVSWGPDSSVPSSLYTEEPPSLVSYSSTSSSDSCSEGEHKHGLGRLSGKIRNCRVSLPVLNLHTWLGPKRQQQQEKRHQRHKQQLRQKRQLEQQQHWKKQQEELQQQQQKAEDRDQHRVDRKPSNPLESLEPETDNDDEVDNEDGDESDDEDHVRDLAELAAQVNADGCESVLALHLSVTRIINNTLVFGPNRQRIRREMVIEYESAVAETFPWFQLDQPAKHWTEWEPRMLEASSSRRPAGRQLAVQQPKEHAYAAIFPATVASHPMEVTLADIARIQNMEREKPEYAKARSGKRIRQRDNFEEKQMEKAADDRLCLLCGAAGDREPHLAGRLLFYRYNEWVHVNCGLWSSEVYETMDGSLINVTQAVARSRTLACAVCGRRGASVGCCHNYCGVSFHFECGLLAQADYKADKTVFCLKHAQKYAHQPNNLTFAVDRLVTVHRAEEEGRKRIKATIDPRQLRVNLGSLAIDRLGCIVDASDTRQALVPVDLSARKTFWSAVNPGQLTCYTLTTKLMAPLSRSGSPPPHHLVVDHETNPEADSTVADFLATMRKNLRLAKLKEPVEPDGEGLLPPSAAGQLWPGLDIAQLRNTPVAIHSAGSCPISQTNGSNSPARPTSHCHTPSKTEHNLTPPSSAHKFNRAVLSFRTPKKHSDDEDCSLRRTEAELVQRLLSSTWEGSDLSANLQVCLVEEVYEQRSWYNANRRVKVRELATQTTQYYDEVQLASNNVYSNLHPPSPDRAFSVKRKLEEEAGDPGPRHAPYHYLSESSRSHGHGHQQQVFSWDLHPKRLGEVATKEEVPRKLPRLDLAIGDIPQLDGGQEDVFCLHLDGAIDDVHERAEGENSLSDAENLFNVVQLDGAGEDSAQPIEVKAEDVKLEAGRSGATPVRGWVTTTAARPAVDSCLSSCSSAAEESSRPSTAGSCSFEQQLLCSDCGNSYSGRKAFAAHLGACGIKMAFKGDVKQEEEEEEDRKPNISISSDGGSPRKDFSIHNLLSSAQQQQQSGQQSQPAPYLAQQNIKQTQPYAQQHKQQPPPHYQQQQTIYQQQPNPQQAGYPQPQTSYQQQSTSYQQQPSKSSHQERQQQQPDKEIKEEEIIIISENINRGASSRDTFRQPSHHSSSSSSRRQLQQQQLAPTFQYINTVTQPAGAPASLYHAGSGATVVQYGAPTYHTQYQAASLLPALVQPGYITLQQQPAPIFYNSGLYSLPFQQQQLVSPYPGTTATLFHPQPLMAAAAAPPAANAYAAAAAPAATAAYATAAVVAEPGPPRLTPEITLLHSSSEGSAAGMTPQQLPPQRKVARVQPTPQVVRPIPTKASPTSTLPPPRFTPPATPSPRVGVSATPTPPPSSKFSSVLMSSSSILARPKLDPMKALTSLSRNPVSSSCCSSTTTSTDSRRWKSESSSSGGGKPPAVIGQRLLFTPPPSAAALINLSRAPPPSQSYITPGADDERSETPTICVDDDDDVDLLQATGQRRPIDSEEVASSPEPPSRLSQQLPCLGVKTDAGGINVTTKPSRTNSIRIVLQRENPSEDYSIREVLIKDGSKATPATIQPQSALQALKIKARISRLMDSKVEAFTVPLYEEDEDSFANEQVVGGDQERKDNEPGAWRPPHRTSEDEQRPPAGEGRQPRVVYSLAAADGSFYGSGNDITVLWQKVYEAVSTARTNHRMSPLPSPLGPTGEQMLGLTHSALRYLLEQFPGANRATKYQWQHQEPPQVVEVKENPTGCARTEGFSKRRDYDMFSWLASRHRKKPHPKVGFRLAPELAADPSLQVASGRRATSLDLPMAMRYRHLAKNAREAVGVYASGIHGRGLFCKREISAGEMVIEYAGEEIRAVLTDKREKMYESKGIGCYMFRVDDDLVVDATMRGNAARFINHSCDPNCYSKIVDILGKKHIIIFSLRKIFPGEELTYDYKFPIEEVKIKCHCGARRCKKYMN